MSDWTKWLGACAIAALAGGAMTTQAAAQSTLEKIKTRGEIVCGTSQGIPGFSLPNAQGV